MSQQENMVPPSYRMLYIGNSPSGLLGLDELLLELLEDGITPDDQALDEKLISGIKKNNFVPKSASNDYATALKHEFSTFYTAKKVAQRCVPATTAHGKGTRGRISPGFQLSLSTFVMVVLPVLKSAQKMYLKRNQMAR